MKKKISRIVGVALTVAMVASLILAVAPVSAKTLEWGEEIIVKAGSWSSPKTVMTSSDVLSLSAADDGKTLWAAVYDETGTIGYVMRSTNGGETFSRKSPVVGTTYDDIAFVAVAPDDPTVIAAAGERSGTNYVFFSNDNGETWSASDISSIVSGTITCLDLSPERDEYRSIAVGDGSGNLAVATAEAFAGWENATVAAWGTGWHAGAQAVLAVKFSPKYDYDGVFIVVTTTASGYAVPGTILQMADVTIAKGGQRWNRETGYPAYVIGTTLATAAQIAVPETYYGVEAAERIAYIGTSNGVYRMEDYTAEVRLKTGNWPAVAYNSDENKLLVGDGNSGRVDMSSNPDSGSPTFVRPTTLKQASGSGVTGVAWLGTEMACATTGTESAVSVSSDAKAWNGLSFCDTDLAVMTDVAIADDGSVMYLVSRDGNYCSVWRKASRWERVLLEDMKAAPALIIRLAPGKPEVAFVAQVGTDEIRSTADSGDTWRRSKSDILVRDMAAADELIVHSVNTAGYVSTSKDGGRTFADYVKSNVSADQIIVEPATGDVIVIGAYVGFVTASISKDDGESFTRTTEELGIPDDGTTPTFVVADPDYATNNLIYAAQKGDGTYIPVIMRWEVGGTMEDWKDITTSTTYTLAATAQITGLGFYGGALYALYTDGYDSGFARTADSTARTPTWAVEERAGTSTAPITFGLEPSAIKLTSGSSKIWAVNTAPTDVDELWSYTDIVEALVAPVLTAPADGYVGTVDATLERINPIRFAWEEVSEYTSYDVRIGTNSAVSQNYITYSAGTSEFLTVAAGTATGEYPFIAGETYYWKARVSKPVVGAWSAVRSFSIEVAKPAVAPAPTITVPAPTITVPAPTITVPAPTVTVPAPTVTVQPAIAPGWLTAIIVIGALLVIAVIVLIVRTRRPA